MISSECITWLAVVLTMSVAISNSEPYLSIVLFIKKKRSLPTRAKLYLVIKLTIVDMFSKDFLTLLRIPYLCDTVKFPHFTLELINNWLSLRLVSSNLSYKHCSNFIGSVACKNSSYTAL